MFAGRKVRGPRSFGTLAADIHAPNPGLPPFVVATMNRCADELVQGPGGRDDANLIAAAPTLLEAAKLVISRWDGGDLAEAVRRLDAAVSEAEGK